MALAAKLYVDSRAAERSSVALDATLRNKGNPYDVLVEDLSASGFRMQAPVDLPENAAISLGLSGIGRHNARVIWRDGDSYGCEFVRTLTLGEVEQARQDDSVVVTDFSVPPQMPDAGSFPEPHVEKWSRNFRLALGLGLAIVSWAVILAVVGLF